MQPQSIPQMFFQACQEFNKPNAVLVKENGEFVPKSHQLYKERVCQMAQGFIHAGLKAGEHVAILSETRWEWAISDLAIVSAGAVDIPIYPTLSADQVAWILQHSDSIGVVVSNQAQAEKINKVRNRLPMLRYFIIMEDVDVQGFQTMKSLEQQGYTAGNQAEFNSRWQNIQPDALLTIMYTSGTTGDPKGVMLTHTNLISNLEACMAIAPFGPDDTHLSHLPLSHVLERMGGYYMGIRSGFTIAYAEDITTVADDMLLVRPTIMFSVPRLYEKIFAKVHANARASGLIKRTVFNWAVAIARKASPELNANRPLSTWLAKKWNMADKLVYSKVREKTGGNLRFMISGGAPLALEISELFIGMGMKMIEGYGLTESSPVLNINLPDRNKPGTVGPAVQGVQIAIAEDGEVLAYGPNIMKGYYKNPEATARTLVSGWLYTGDIGVVDEDGYLTITDRKKDLLITSNGKNVAPQPIESKLKLSPFIENAVIIGDNRNYITALIVPPWETITDWAPAQSWPTEPAELARLPEFEEFVAREISILMKDFGNFEQIKQFTILGKPFSIDTGELTPSLKVKRKVIAKKFAKHIEAMYT